MEQKRSLTGWAFLLPAALLIFVFCFYPMVQALILSFQKGTGSAVQPAGFANYVRILKDATFQQCLFNTIFYFVIQVPIMLILALILAQLLNSPDIKGKGIYRTMIFLPCATSLVSYSMIFKSCLPTMVWSTGCCPPWASPQWIGSRTHGRHAGSSSLRWSGAGPATTWSFILPVCRTSTTRSTKRPASTALPRSSSLFT